MTTILGLILGILAIVVATVMDGNSFGALIGPSSLVLVVVGSVGVSIAGYQMGDIQQLPKAIIVSFTGKEPDGSTTVDQLMDAAEIARKEGVLALESKLEDFDDEFIRQGLQMVVDGVDADTIRENLEIDISALEERHQRSINMLKTMGGYAPTMGMIGTVVGLINMLGNLSDPAQLGLGMSVALLTTLYGVIFANLVFLPMAAKLVRLNDLELANRDLALDGILAIQSGISPRALVERLESYLLPTERVGHQVRNKREAA